MLWKAKAEQIAKIVRPINDDSVQEKHRSRAGPRDEDRSMNPVGHFVVACALERAAREMIEAR